MAALQERTEVRDNMRIDWNVPIEMDDGLVLRADVFRPVKEGHYPVILTYGPYAKNLSFQEGHPTAWDRMATKHPDVTAGSSNLYQNWEVVDPEKWVPHDYACVRVDSRGAGCSPGLIDHFSPRETKDLFDCIEWAGKQRWSKSIVVEARSRAEAATMRDRRHSSQACTAERTVSAAPRTEANSRFCPPTSSVVHMPSRP